MIFTRGRRDPSGDRLRCGGPRAPAVTPGHAVQTLCSLSLTAPFCRVLLGGCSKRDSRPLTESSLCDTEFSSLLPREPPHFCDFVEPKCSLPASFVSPKQKRSRRIQAQPVPSWPFPPRATEARLLSCRLISGEASPGALHRRTVRASVSQHTFPRPSGSRRGHDGCRGAFGQSSDPLSTGSCACRWLSAGPRGGLRLPSPRALLAFSPAGVCGLWLLRDEQDST